MTLGSTRPTLVVGFMLVASAWSCTSTPPPEAAAPATPAAQPSAPAAPAESPAEAAPAPTALQVTGSATLTKVLLGTPSGGGMVDLEPAEAPEGSVFLVIGFVSPAPPATEPSLEGPRGVTYPLRTYIPSEGGGEANAIFEVEGKPAKLTLRHGEFSTEVSLEKSDQEKR